MLVALLRFIYGQSRSFKGFKVSTTILLLSWKVLLTHLLLLKLNIYLKERNQRWHKQMERYTMFLDWKNQHCQKDYTSQGNLQIQCNPYQISNDIFHRTRIKNLTICMETQKTPKIESILRKKSRAKGIRIPDFWLYYKATVIKTAWYCTQQNYRLAEWKRKPRKYSRTYAQLICDKGGKTTQWRKDTLSNKWAGKLDS